jgi:hypothetical protein
MQRFAAECHEFKFISADASLGLGVRGDRRLVVRVDVLPPPCRQKAGYSAGQAREPARSLGLIPTRRETRIVANTAQAEAKAKRVRDLLNSIHNRTVRVNVLINESRIDKVNNQLDRLGARATGGPAKWGKAYMVGEHRRQWRRGRRHDGHPTPGAARRRREPGRARPPDRAGPAVPLRPVRKVLDVDHG